MPYNKSLLSPLCGWDGLLVASLCSIRHKVKRYVLIR